MKIKELIYRIKPPCGRCPYKSGMVKTVVNPCSQCKLDGCYTSYEWFRKLQWQGKEPENRNK